MLVFLAILGVSIAALLLVQAVDIEGVAAPKRRTVRAVSQPAKADAGYPNGAAAGAR